MNLDIESIKQAINAFGTALSVLKQAKDLLPDGKNKEQVSENIDQAERQLKIAEGQIAHALGYELCRKHFPPVIMFSEDDLNWECPECRNKKYTGTTLAPNPFS